MKALAAALALALVGCHRKAPPNASPNAAPAPTAASPNAASPAGSAASLTARLDAIRKAEHLPALGLAVWRDGRMLALATTGLRRAGDAAHPVTDDDQWHLGSDTKAMTATLVGIYVDRGKLRWNETLPELFPDLTIDPGYAHVTIDQLLEHRGGAPHEEPGEVWQRAWADGARPEARANYVRGILARPPAQPPGTYAYSNAGYVLLGAALEHATGKTWEQLVRADLFAPLGMTSCGFGPPGDARAVDEPWGHHVHGDANKADPVSPADPQADNPPALTPAGRVHCSLRDWIEFLAIHTGAPQTLVTPATLAHLHTAPELPGEHYMGGWIVVPVHPGDTRLTHTGSNTMWYAIALVVPVLHEAIAVVANAYDDRLFAAITPLLQDYLRP